MSSFCVNMYPNWHLNDSEKRFHLLSIQLCHIICYKKLCRTKSQCVTTQQHIIVGQTISQCVTTANYCRANPTGEGSIELSSASLGSGDNGDGGRWMYILRPFLAAFSLLWVFIEPSKVLDGSQKQVRVSFSRVLIEPLGSVWASSRARINNSRDIQLPPFHSKQVGSIVVSWSWQNISIVIWRRKKRWWGGLWVL